MSHDAATSDLDDINIIQTYTQTQAPGSLASQLDCGARAFDYRPYLQKDNVLIAHHGGIKVKTNMKDSVKGVIDWLQRAENSEELVLLYISHCEADGDNDTKGSRCEQSSAELLKQLGIYTLTDCTPLVDLSVDTVKESGRLLNGGSIIAIFNCVNENYVDSVNCWGFHDKREYSCYGKHKEVAWDSFKTYLNDTSGPSSTSNDNLWMLQAHWQSTSTSISLGDLHLSSVLKDESKAGVNAWLANTIRNRELPYEKLNLIKLDNVCDGGNDVLAALRESWA
jgi:hypothetical protein